MKYQIPVEPTILANGAIASLINLASPEEIKISGNAPQSIPDTVHGTIKFGSVDASVAASAGFGQMLEFNASTKAEYLLSDVQMILDPVPGRGIIENEYYGVSWRLCIKSWNVSSSAKGDVSKISAECSINGGSATMQSHIYGIDNQLLVDVIPSLCSVVGNFDIGSLQQIKIAQNMVMEIFSSKEDEIRSRMKPVLLGVDLLKKFDDPYIMSPSAVYAFHAINKGYNYSDAISSKHKPQPPSGMTIDDSIIRDIYMVIVGSTSIKPSSAQKSAAYKSVFRDDNN